MCSISWPPDMTNTMTAWSGTRLSHCSHRINSTWRIKYKGEEICEKLPTSEEKAAFWENYSWTMIWYHLYYLEGLAKRVQSLHTSPLDEHQGCLHRPRNHSYSPSHRNVSKRSTVSVRDTVKDMTQLLF